MRKTMMLFVTGLLLAANLAYAGNGDLIVDGNVGVGTNIPQEKLHVVGNEKLESGQIHFFTPYNDASGSTGISANPNGWSAIDPNGSRFIITVRPEDVSSSKNILDIERIDTWQHMMELYADGTMRLNGVYYASDSLLKKDVETIPMLINKLKKVHGVYYKWKDPLQDPGRQIGIIAQDIEAVFPEIVKVIDNPLCSQKFSNGCTPLKVKAIDYAKLSAVALQGIKELAETVEQLEQRILKLEQVMVIK